MREASLGPVKSTAGRVEKLICHVFYLPLAFFTRRVITHVNFKEVHVIPFLRPDHMSRPPLLRLTLLPWYWHQLAFGSTPGAPTRNRVGGPKATSQAGSPKRRAQNTPTTSYEPRILRRHLRDEPTIRPHTTRFTWARLMSIQYDLGSSHRSPKASRLDISRRGRMRAVGWCHAHGRGWRAV